MFEGDFADIFAEQFPLLLMGGKSNPVRRAQMRSKDPNRPEWKQSPISAIEQNKIFKLPIWYCILTKIGQHYQWRVQTLDEWHNIE